MTFSLKVAAQNFGDDPDVGVMIMVVAIIGLVLLMVIAGELGRRGQAEEAGAG
jgi:predicted Na+-dependent transporter